MKKLIVGLLMAALTTLGLVGVSTTPASAVPCTPGSYTGCVVGKLRVNKTTKIRYNTAQNIRVRVTTPGNAVPTGKIKVTVKRIGGGYTYKFPYKPYSGKPIFFKTPKLKVPGRYKIIAVFKANAPFADLKNPKKKFVVKPKGFV